MPKHQGRVIHVRCNYTDTSTTPATFYRAGKYTYDYTSDAVRQNRIDAAIAEYKADNELPDNADVEYTYSVQSNK